MAAKELQDKTILVTGASRGIGLAIVRKLLLDGASVVAHTNKNKEFLEKEFSQCLSNKLQIVSQDLGIRDSGFLLWEKAISSVGQLDGIINNAGIFKETSIDDDPLEWQKNWQETLQVNLFSVADLCKSSLNHFIPKKNGFIINIASRAAYRGDGPTYMHYASSKGGLVALSKTIARGYSGKGIQCYCICPGYVDTEMAESFTGPSDPRKDIPSGNIASPEEVAEIVWFLSRSKTKEATGTVIDINGASYVR